MSATLTFQDPNGNPLPAAVRADFYSGSSIAPNASPVESDYVQVGGTVQPTTLTNGAYTVSFYGTWAPSTTVTFTYNGSNQTLTVSGYQSPTYSQAGFATSQAKRWVRGAYGGAARTSGGVAYNLAYGLSYALLTLSQFTQQVMQAMRLPTSVGTSVATWAADFFGGNLPQLSGETTAAYIARIKANLSAKKGLISGIITVGQNYGTTTAVEPWMASATGAYDTSSPTMAYDSLGCCGNQKPDVSVYIQPASQLSNGDAQQANLEVLGAKAAGIKVTAYQVLVGTTQPIPLTSWQQNSGPNREGVISGVLADGSATVSVTHSATYVFGHGAVRFGISNYSGSDNASLRVRVVGDPSLTGFTAIVSGGQSGSTVHLHYRASGDLGHFALPL